MEQPKQIEIKNARTVAIVVGILTVTSLVLLTYSTFLNVKIEKLTKEVTEVKKQLEDCRKSTAH